MIPFLLSMEYEAPRLLPTGEWAAVQRMAFTWGLMVGLDEYGYRTRFCYQYREDAIAALQAWDGSGDPAGPWIKEKGVGVDRLGPGAL